ncbi:MAG: hypothetical protein ACJATT_004921 [Myxococcota bacterium]
MDLAEAKRRDSVLRAYAIARDWDLSVEARLTRTLIQASYELLPKYPFLIDWEWEEVPGQSQDGRGDLLFFDGLAAYAVVEVKCISGSGTNTRRRNAVEKQALRYQVAAQTRFPGGHVVAFVFTDDPDYPGLRRPRVRGVGLVPSASSPD